MGRAITTTGHRRITRRHPYLPRRSRLLRPEPRPGSARWSGLPELLLRSSAGSPDLQRAGRSGLLHAWLRHDGCRARHGPSNLPGRRFEDAGPIRPLKSIGGRRVAGPGTETVVPGSPAARPPGYRPSFSECREHRDEPTNRAGVVRDRASGQCMVGEAALRFRKARAKPRRKCERWPTPCEAWRKCARR